MIGTGSAVIPPIFMLSPAYCGGRRAGMLLNPASEAPLACRLRGGDLTLGEAFAFMSGLYFRGKLTYARAFAPALAHRATGPFVITPTRGLVAPEALVSAALLREFASVDVDAGDDRYRAPLARDLEAIAREAPADARVVLLGSIATGKYVDVLAAWLGPRLHVPPAFIGRGDMSRGGLLLRAAREGRELEYVVFNDATQRRGPRPPRLTPLRRTHLPNAL